MKNKRLPLLAAVVVLSFVGWLTDKKMMESSNETAPSASAQPRLAMEYTKHARCRMKCRHISEPEILDVLARGTVNFKKSNPQATPCPVKAVEGKTADDQVVRVVYGECGTIRKIITVIDLKNDHACDCN